MGFLKKRGAAFAVMILAILIGLALGRARAPDGGGGVTGSFDYLLHNQDNVLSQDIARYIEAMNTSLFAQTGAQIVVDVVDSTGNNIASYAESVFSQRGVGSRERNNGLLLVLALRDEYNGAPDGDYYLAWGSGFSSSQQERLDDILWTTMESGFAAKRYDEAVRATFDALVDYLESLYHVTVTTASPASVGSFQARSGGYAATGAPAVLPQVLLGEVFVLLLFLFFLWVIADAFRYRRYRRRTLFPGARPRPYFPVFWGRRRSFPPPPPPPRPPSPPPKPPAGGFSRGGLFGGGTGRSSSSRGGFSSGGSFGGGAGRSSAPRPSSRAKARPSRGAPPRRSGGGGRRR